MFFCSIIRFRFSIFIYMQDVSMLQILHLDNSVSYNTKRYLSVSDRKLDVNFYGERLCKNDILKPI